MTYVCAPTLATDAELVAGIVSGDDVAFAEVHRRHAGTTEAIARRVLIDPGFAEEVVQEVFLRLWQEPGRFDPLRGSLRSWLAAQARGRAIDRVRSETAHRRRAEADAQVDVTLVPDVEGTAVHRSTADLLKAALGSLPGPEREAIVMAYFGGWTYRQVAALLAVPEGTVKSRIRQGMGRLRTALDGVIDGSLDGDLAGVGVLA